MVGELTAAAKVGPRLTLLEIADPAASWHAAGLPVADDAVQLERTRLQLTADSAATGVTGWGFEPSPPGETLDGVPLVASGAIPSTGTSAGPHPNGVTSIDHVVVATPHLDRTIDALVDAGFELRRTRATRLGDRPATQAFLWAGDVILEVMGVDGEEGDGPATIWGLAMVADDLDRTVAWLGPDRCGPAGDAVQTGRRIATVRTRALGISVPIALMTPHR